MDAIAAAYKRGLRSDSRAYICAISDSQTVAFGSLTIKNSLWQQGLIGHIDELIVHHDYRRRGIGRRLLSHLEMIAAGRKCGRLELDSAFHRKAAHGFYKNEGFENRAFLFSKKLHTATEME